MNNAYKIIPVLLVLALITGCQAQANPASEFDLQVLLELSIGSPVRQLRAVPVNLGDNAPRAILAVYGEDSEVDPYVEMFFFPTGTLKFILFTEEGKILWRRDLGRGVVPGTWFCPVFPFDLDRDGSEEIWFVNNPDSEHPLGISKYRLERLDAATGETNGHWPWPQPPYGQSLSHQFRNFILGGYVKGELVLVTAQGTYGPINIQGWNPGMSLRWEHRIAKETPGARGSHMCPVIDINHDNVDEILWGERCIELDTGRELFCADRDSYKGHSDVIQPVLDRRTNRWYIHTCRESGKVPPRVAFFDDTGRRLWGDLEQGHIDMGWTARIGEGKEHIVMAIRIGGKTAGPKGFFRTGVEEFTYKALTGEKYPLPFSVYRTLPVDLNGDGIHELLRPSDKGGCEVIERTGQVIAKIGGGAVLASKFMDHPGEQVLCFYPDGTLRIWADRNAKDTPEALARYNNPFYKANQRLTATGSNRANLGGL